MSDKMVAPRPAIARIWHGRTRPERADAYEAYNYDVGIKPLIEKALGVQTLREDRRDETEFWTISYWESIAAMSRFTGDDPPPAARCRVPDRAAVSRADSQDPRLARRHRR
jgi:heme-degrading monooxygenase HmoA